MFLHYKVIMYFIVMNWVNEGRMKLNDRWLRLELSYFLLY